MKSIARFLNQPSGMGVECKGPMGLHVGDVFHWQDVHKGIYVSSRSFHILGQ